MRGIGTLSLIYYALDPLEFLRLRPTDPAGTRAIGRFPGMAEPEEQLRGLAAAIVEEYGEDAHQWTKRRAAHFQNEGEFDVAWLVLKIRRGA